MVRAWQMLVRPYNGSVILSAISSMTGLDSNSLLMQQTIAVPTDATAQPVYASQIVTIENNEMLLSIQDTENVQN